MSKTTTGEAELLRLRQSIETQMRRGILEGIDLVLEEAREQLLTFYAGGVSIVQEITMCEATFEVRNTEGYRSSQTEIIALRGSSRAESETETRFTPKRLPRS